MTSRLSGALFGRVHPAALLQRFPQLRHVQNVQWPKSTVLSERHFVTASPRRQWKNETPPGGLTELYVYRPESERIWLDATLGVFSPQDPSCCLPGNIGLCSEVSLAAKSDPAEASTVAQSANTSKNLAAAAPSDLFTRYTAKEHQAQTLHSACDYIQHTRDAEGEVCRDILEVFPELDGMRNAHCKIQDAPGLLRRELQTLFPERDVNAGNLSVLTMAQKTVNDMTGWSSDVEEERELLAERFVAAAKEICGRLRGEGFWADFIDPYSGTPHFHAHSSTTMFETDEKCRMLGFRIEDLGCCKVITHKNFGRNVFVGTVFTDATAATGVVQDIFGEMNLALDGFLNKPAVRPQEQLNNVDRALHCEGKPAGEVK